MSALAQRAAETEQVAPRTATVIETPTARIARLNALYRQASPREIVAAAYAEFGEGLAIVSSFGAEAAVTLHVTASVSRDIPVIFLETGMHFAQTLDYRDELTAFLGLRELRNIRPDAGDLAAQDPKNGLWRSNTDACCAIRKTAPLERALTGVTAWITGRKRFHGGERLALAPFEWDGERYKVNPLANMGRAAVEDYFTTHQLPRSPLVEMGYASIGCWPCTKPADGDDIRGGRWSGSGKTECGIHHRRPDWTSLTGSEL